MKFRNKLLYLSAASFLALYSSSESMPLGKKNLEEDQTGRPRAKSSAALSPLQARMRSNSMRSKNFPPLPEPPRSATPEPAPTKTLIAQTKSLFEPKRKEEEKNLLATSPAASTNKASVTVEPNGKDAEKKPLTNGIPSTSKPPAKAAEKEPEKKPVASPSSAPSKTAAKVESTKMEVEKKPLHSSTSSVSKAPAKSVEKATEEKPPASPTSPATKSSTPVKLEAPGSLTYEDLNSIFREKNAKEIKGMRVVHKLADTGSSETGLGKILACLEKYTCTLAKIDKNQALVGKAGTLLEVYYLYNGEERIPNSRIIVEFSLK